MVSDTVRPATPAPVRSGGAPAGNRSRILVPIHYPLTTASTKTLERAARIAARDDAEAVVVLHVVERFQHRRCAPRWEIYRDVSPMFPDRAVSLSVTRDFLVEEAILEEAKSVRADVIVVGKTQKRAWRRLLDRVASKRDLVPFLRAHTDADVVVVE